jgi:hypothetical protein
LTVDTRISRVRHQILTKGLVDELKELEELDRLPRTRSVNVQQGLAEGDHIRPVWERFKELCSKIGDDIHEPGEDPKALADWLSWNVRRVSPGTLQRQTPPDSPPIEA